MKIKQSFLVMTLSCVLSLNLAACDKATKLSSDSASETLAQTIETFALLGISVFSQVVGVDDEQKKCLSKISFTDNISSIKTDLEKQFTAEELEQGLTVYNDPDVVALLKYSLTDIKALANLKEDDPMFRTKASADKKMEDFAKTEVGKRFSTFMEKKVGELPVQDKIEACGVK